MHQKARATWIKLGGANSKYFSAMVKERQNQKQIVELKSLTGKTREDFKKEILAFYKGLMGISAEELQTVDKLIMWNGPKLNQVHITMLCEPVTEKEINEALASIGDDKAPSIDGYNAYFLRTFCT